MRSVTREALNVAHIVKLNQEELAFLIGGEPRPESLLRLLRPHHQLLTVTLGEQGSYYLTRKQKGFVPSARVKCVDTTGAGDAFVAGMLSQICIIAAGGKTVADADTHELYQLFRFANACGALATTARGAIPSLPSRRRVQTFLGRHSNSAR
jgi:fructokinase